jgi:peptidyl-prolyl cis-trans isomerase SurA
MVRSEVNEEATIAAEKKEKVLACYNELKSGMSFISMVKKYSEDAGTARNHGEMRWIRSGELPPELENVVFSLSDSGAYTEPLRSDYGWHIFLLQGKRPIAPFEQLKPQLEEKIMMDERGKRTEQSFITNLKKEYKYIDYPENIAMISEIMDSSVYSGNWKPEESGTLIEPVFTIGGKDFSQMDLIDFILKTKRYNEKDAFTTIVNRKLNELVFNELLNHEKKQLEEKYPTFRYLMEEYHDGILLFNIMDAKVWSLAVNDTNGLKTFYENHAGNYKWQERADVSVYTLKDPALLKSTIKLAKKRIQSNWKPEEFVRMLCVSDTTDCVTVTDQKYEKNDPLPLGGFTWKKGAVKTVKEANGTKVLVVNGIIPPGPKAFVETQGQVTADYQNYLDRQWIDSLRARYEVVVNQDVLKLVK